ncbi:MAG: hypothetical protein ABFS14_04450 [Gemmatimonadota bacterium]
MGCSASVLCLLLTASPALAQQQPWDPPGESVASSSVISLDEAATQCLLLLWPNEPGSLSDNLIAEDCEVVDSGQLVMIGDNIWCWVMYRHTSVWGPDEDTREQDLDMFPDTVAEAELVLFAGARGKRVFWPVWHDRVETDFELLSPPRAQLLVSGGAAPTEALLVHRRCLNGTGGCLDYPFLVSENEAITPLRPRYREQLQNQLPDGWGMWKGTWLDPARRLAQAPVYLPEDANCCPSLAATATLSIQGDTLVADSIAIEPVPGHDTWQVLPGERFGPITPTTSEADLRQLLGASAVVSEEIYLAEGFCAAGVRIFPGSPLELELAWVDSARTHPAFVRSRIASGAWRTPLGVGVGTTLKELEELRGQPISFSGFGWDYGGGSSWDEHTGTLGLRLEIDPTSDQKLRELDRTDPRARELWGDQSVRSDHPIVRQLTIRVYEIGLTWGMIATEKECEA